MVPFSIMDLKEFESLEMTTEFEQDILETGLKIYGKARGKSFGVLKELCTNRDQDDWIRY